ncbi:MAG: hypothetical protein JKY54_18745 [Flavobacteriales bacterium]|nr:hypothetical protein [Flavobacteriales bacterium]
MAKDFTLATYRLFLEALIDQEYHCCSYLHQIENSPAKFIVLRHDVDKRPNNSLATAQLQKSLGITGTYYFRCVDDSFHPAVIEEIASLGHEIGYHYEDLSLANGNVEQAKVHFEKWLEKLRAFYPVKTICMHGSPLSKTDNRDIWKSLNYRDYDIVGEPYFDLDFNEVLYITDTGRSWNKSQVSVRDKVDSGYNYKFKSTFDLIEQIKQGKLPNKIMQNIHPQRWTDDGLSWVSELVAQNAKNVIKRALFVKK